MRAFHPYDEEKETQGLSIRDQIASLESLARIDAELRRLDDELAQDRGTLENLRSEQKDLEEKLAADRDRIAEMEKLRMDLVTEARQMGTQVERSREKLSRSRNEREANAAQREVEELRKLQRDREEEAKKLSTLVDEAKKSVAEVEAQLEAVTSELAEKESPLASNLGGIAKERETKAQERAALAAKVPSLTLRRYEQVRQRKGTGLAQAKDGICQACHISLPPMLVQQLMRNEAFDQCPNCKRILYWPPPPMPSPTAEP